LKTPRLFRFQQKFPDHDCEIISEKPTPFDLWSEWAEKPFDCMLTIDAGIHEAVMGRMNAATVPRSARLCTGSVTDDRSRAGHFEAGGELARATAKRDHEPC
jgi:hypothetical protein